ncbi:ribbon-helix-helix domain-containing protein [Acidithrix ferrooxidans]|uniref:Ribbon-helix-helix protein CopG domain-containing protein n=1 Tax=Acidithrix ferrooxidans TaxID=1280514 RepID=A0A0D8HD44_9ACTN|nr:ribbon-helix-helix domain-containing protein [Acidithrix ferrooxidans]KJF15833.1 hypothetical protein AXFE_33160 [Acidithrix ferrooxidans]
MPQIVTRLDEDLAKQVDKLIADGIVPSRSEAVRIGLEWFVDKHRRESIGLAIAESFLQRPQSEEEIIGIEGATKALIEEEPW